MYTSTKIPKSMLRPSGPAPLDKVAAAHPRANGGACQGPSGPVLMKRRPPRMRTIAEASPQQPRRSTTIAAAQPELPSRKHTSTAAAMPPLAPPEPPPRKGISAAAAIPPKTPPRRGTAAVTASPPDPPARRTLASSAKSVAPSRTAAPSEPRGIIINTDTNAAPAEAAVSTQKVAKTEAAEAEAATAEAATVVQAAVRGKQSRNVLLRRTVSLSLCTRPALPSTLRVLSILDLVPGLRDLMRNLTRGEGAQQYDMPSDI